MGHLPALRAEHPGRLVLDATAQALPALTGLACAFRADPDGIGALLADLADLDDSARTEAHLDGLGHAEHARDQVAEQLLREAGGAELHLHPDRDRHAAHQARRIAEEARRIADRLDRHASGITVEVEDAERRRAAEQAAELATLRARLGHLGCQASLASQLAPAR